MISNAIRAIVKAVEMVAVTLAIPAMFLLIAGHFAYNTQMYAAHGAWFNLSWYALVLCSLLAHTAAWIGNKFWPPYHANTRLGA